MTTPQDATPQSHVPTKGLYGQITHTDISSADPAATRAWCAKVLGWEFRPPFPTPAGEYHLFTYSPTGGGGIQQAGASNPIGSVPFIHVANAQEAFDLAVREGAEPVHKPECVMEGVTIAAVRAPGGVMIGFSGP